MSIKKFSAEEILVLKQNPFTRVVTTNKISFTAEFKKLFMTEYNNGKIPRQILIDHGYQPEMLGDRRIWGIAQKIREQDARHDGQFKDPPQSTAGKASKHLTEKEQLQQLERKFAYLEQEVEYLKKISSVRSTRK